MDLDQALEKHAHWKVKFRQAINNKESMDAETIAKDNCCELGKWLHGEGKTTLGNLNSFNECVALHAAFHVEAGKVANAINTKKFTRAETMIGAGTRYANASSAVAMAIIKLKKSSLVAA
jgi:Chemoreceptor zinc-binding domain